MVKDFADRYMIFRTAWLYGDGRNFVKTMLRLAENGDKVRVVEDQVGSPTSARELARAITSQLFTDNYGLFHATCEGNCSWADFAREIFRLAGQGLCGGNHISGICCKGTQTSVFYFGELYAEADRWLSVCRLA